MEGRHETKHRCQGQTEMIGLVEVMMMMMMMMIMIIAIMAVLMACPILFEHKYESIATVGESRVW